MTPPKVGSVWERDGKRRDVVGVNPKYGFFEVTWRYHGKTSTRVSWGSTWDAWASKAKEVTP